MIKINQSQIKNHIKLIKNYRYFFDVVTNNNTDKIIKYLKSQKSITINPKEQKRINKKMFEKMKGGDLLTVAAWISSLFGQVFDIKISANIPIPNTAYLKDRRIQGMRPLKIVIITLVGFICVFHDTINACITNENQLKDAQEKFIAIQIDIDDGKYFDTTITERLIDARQNVLENFFGSSYQSNSKVLQNYNYIDKAIERFGEEDGLIFINKAKAKKLIKDEKVTGSMITFMNIMAKYDNLILHKDKQRNIMEKLRPDTFCKFIKFTLMQTKNPKLGGENYTYQIARIILKMILDTKDMTLKIKDDPKNMFNNMNMNYMSEKPFATILLAYMTALIAKFTFKAFMKLFNKDKLYLEILLELFTFDILEFGKNESKATSYFKLKEKMQRIFEENRDNPHFQEEYMRLNLEEYMRLNQRELRQFRRELRRRKLRRSERLAIQYGNGENKKIKKSKKIRKHKGINQKTGRLNKGYKYSGKKLKSGLRQIVKK